MERIMGLDVGSKTVGIAISDPLNLTAQGHSVLRWRSYAECLDQLAWLIQQFQITTIVVGLPKNMNNTIGSQGMAAQKFAERLRRRTDLPVILWDERLTTQAAQKLLQEQGLDSRKQRGVVDMVAATFILEGYLASRKEVQIN
ncbi:MAG: Holliday junction resolvase RuvX [Symbiobacteriaceae bacterium]|nr:Holliday junction resolvase RuvX [Symbiobacteriaceae bacterium]